MSDSNQDSSLDALIRADSAARERRNADMRAAFRHPNALALSIRLDCANLIATVGGYAAPLEQEARVAWIREKLRQDSGFVAKVRLAESLVREYVKHASDHKERIP
jgi:uncharacterized protein (DUF2236 family)